MVSRMPVDAIEQDIPEAASLTDVIRAINADRRQHDPARVALVVREAIRQAAPHIVAAATHSKKQLVA